MKKSILLLVVLLPMMAMAQKSVRHSLEIGGGALLTENYFKVMNHCGGSGSVQYGFGPIEHLDVVARLTVGKGVEGGMRIYDGGDYVSVMNYRTYDFRLGARGYMDFGNIWSVKLTGFLGGQFVPYVYDKYYDNVLSHGINSYGTMDVGYGGSAMIGGFTLELTMDIAKGVDLGVYYDFAGTIVKKANLLKLSDLEPLCKLSMPATHTLGLKLGFEL